MLSPAGLEDSVAGFTYWPGWEFRVYLDPHLGPMIWITGTVRDRDDHGKTTDLGIRSRIPPHAMAGEQSLARWLLWRLEEVAIHEVREGLRFDGKLVDDPHAES